MKKTILIATLALLIAAPANAQTFMVRPCWRPFARLRVFCQVQPCQGGSCAAPSCQGGSCQLPSCQGGSCAEYVPTTEGNVPAHEYLEAKKNGGAPIATTFMAAANRIRARYGLPTLASDATLDAGCASQANYCAATGALIHGAGVAEILAQNTSGFEAALNQWLASPAHRAILLSGRYRVAGVAVVRDRNGRVWCAMRFRRRGGQGE